MKTRWALSMLVSVLVLGMVSSSCGTGDDMSQGTVADGDALTGEVQAPAVPAYECLTGLSCSDDEDCPAFEWCNESLTPMACQKEGCGDEGTICDDDVLCAEGLSCDAGRCSCVPDCHGKECGDDGCGGSCGGCENDLVCLKGACTDTYCWPDCEMVLVPAGAFPMGCSSKDPSCGPDELPGHLVYIDAFYIDVTEVTVEAYAACVDASACGQPSRFLPMCTWNKAGKGSYPANCLPWEDADSYCSWVGKRLCTEAEWEKAARGPDGAIYPWGGSPPTCEAAVFNETGDGCGLGGTWPVGSKLGGISYYGALDMAGNVWEWVSDWYDPEYFDVSPYENPGGPSGGSIKLRKGGAFDSKKLSLRASERNAFSMVINENVGFRCCMDAQ